MERFWFWLLFIPISGYLLGKLYFAFSKKTYSRLRVAAIAAEALALSLFYFPWLPSELGGATGFELLAARHADVVAVFILLACAFIFFIANRPLFIKIGAVLHITATVVLFGALLRILPGTYSFQLSEMASIATVLLMLITNVVVLFLWHQLQLQKGKHINIWGGKKFTALLLLF